jgi:hypothetical protein
MSSSILSCPIPPHPAASHPGAFCSTPGVRAGEVLWEVCVQMGHSKAFPGWVSNFNHSGWALVHLPCGPGLLTAETIPCWPGILVFPTVHGKILRTHKPQRTSCSRAQIYRKKVWFMGIHTVAVIDQAVAMVRTCPRPQVGSGLCCPGSYSMFPPLLRSFQHQLPGLPVLHLNHLHI